MILVTKMAAEVNKNSGQSKLLTAKDIQKIAHEKSQMAKEQLGRLLEIPQFNNGLNKQQKELYFAYIYDNIMFSTEKGFPWEHICLVVKCAQAYLQRIITENHQFSEARQDLSEVIGILAPLTDRHKKQFTKFVFDTILCHYNLYKYVFLHNQETIKPEIEQTVELPPIPMPIRKGESQVVWEYNKKLKEIDVVEVQAIQKQQEEKEKLQKMSTNHKTLEDLNDIPVPVNEVMLKELLTDVLTGFTEKKEMELKLCVDELINNLNFKLQKVTMPRPPGLVQFNVSNSDVTQESKRVAPKIEEQPKKASAFEGLQVIKNLK